MRSLDKIACGLLLVIAITSSPAAPAVAKAPADRLDPTFGQGGFVISDQAPGVVTDLAEDPQRRLIAAGTSVTGFVLARYLANGSPDRTFGKGPRGGAGVVTTNTGGGAFGVAVQSDGKILAAGSNGAPQESTRFVLARYRKDGSLDRGFGDDGLAKTRIGQGGAGRALALQRDGRILVGGFVGPPPYLGFHRKPSGMVVRYLADGSIDSSFARHGYLFIGAGGNSSVAVTDLETLAGGRILVAGNLGGRLLLERLLPDGSPDPSFGGVDGRVTTRIGHNTDCLQCPIASAAALAPDGDILLAGSAGGNSAVARYQANGAVDLAFGHDGVVRLPRMGSFGAVRDLIIEPNGRIVLAGGSEFKPIMRRLLADGSPDRNFAGTGTFSRRFGNFAQFCAVLQQPGGRLILGGRADEPPISLEDEGGLSSARFLLVGLRP